MRIQVTLDDVLGKELKVKQKSLVLVLVRMLDTC
jgi:hypothetical protein